MNIDAIINLNSSLQLDLYTQTEINLLNDPHLLPSPEYPMRETTRSVDSPISLAD